MSQKSTTKEFTLSWCFFVLGNPYVAYRRSNIGDQHHQMWT
jgi:hypothetical protein